MVVILRFVRQKRLASRSCQFQRVVVNFILTDVESLKICPAAGCHCAVSCKTQTLISFNVWWGEGGTHETVRQSSMQSPSLSWWPRKSLHEICKAVIIHRKPVRVSIINIGLGKLWFFMVGAYKWKKEFWPVSFDSGTEVRTNSEGGCYVWSNLPFTRRNKILSIPCLRIVEIVTRSLFKPSSGLALSTSVRKKYRPASCKPSTKDLRPRRWARRGWRSDPKWRCPPRWSSSPGR